jgi:S-DNA-T family DNA segregation ATPase FtsK/SpoIIIE
LAWLLKTPTFLFFALLSPVVALGTWWSERWSGRRTRRRDTARHAAELVAAEHRLADAVQSFLRGASTHAPDLAALTAAARRRTSLLWSRHPYDEDALTIRLGTGPGVTGVVRRHPDGVRVPEPADHLPVTVDVRASGGLAVTGPRERALGVLRSVIGQLAVLHSPGNVDLMLLVDAERRYDWHWMRWLPQLTSGGVTVLDTAGHGPGSEERIRAWLGAVLDRRRSDARPSGGARPTGPASWSVVVVDGTVSAATAAALRDIRPCGVVVLTHAASTEALPVPIDAILHLTGETGDLGILRHSGLPDRNRLTVDRLPLDVAAALARDLAGLEPATSRAALPAQVRLLDLELPGITVDATGGASGTWLTTRGALIAPVGAGADGTYEVDLCRHGPHALVAGTTGSGKSELLQTMIAGLALNHPPDRCSFLLVDYKGGAAFAEAAALPHTVGILTDLDSQTTARALRSLTAELVRREEVLARHGVADIAALPEDVDLARLVIVVDEFATLAEELPSFVPGLIGIAQRGRSLGVHLVLATQRPGGIVSPEIRANCTLRICLRTTDEADSRDVLGSAAAAHLPVERPGRALVRCGGGAPVPIQVARVSQPVPRDDDGEPQVRLWSWPGTPLVDDGPPAGDRDTDLSRLVRALDRLARTHGTPTPHRPWRPPLTGRVTVADLQSLHPDADRPLAPEELIVGLLDHPDQQAQRPLVLDLREGGGWLAVGGPRSGRTSLLRTILRESARRSDPERLHTHVIDLGGGSLAVEATELPHTGTAIGREDTFRTARLIDRLTREVAARRAGGPWTADGPLLLLLVDGVESLTTMLDDCDPGRGSAAFLQLVREGAAVGLTCVLTTDRAVPGGRLASVAARRLVLPLPDRADYAVAGIPLVAVPSARPPGRALVGENAVECQLAMADPVPLGTARPRPADSAHRPVRIVELEPDPALPLPVDAAPDRNGVLLPIGPGGDEGEAQTVDLGRTGGLLIVGPPGSGRSSVLAACTAHLVAARVPVLRITPASRPPEEAPDGDARAWAAAGDGAAVSAWLDRLDGRFGVVCADDVGAPVDSAALLTLPALAAGNRVALVAAGGAGQLSAHYQGPVSTLRRGRSGLLLCPSAAEADVLGLRLPRTPVPARPGSGWLISAGTAERIQAARHRPPQVRT